MSIKIKVTHGAYIIDSWDDVLPLRVCVSTENKMELYRKLTHHQDRLIRAGKLDGMMWIQDLEDEFSVTRQWARNAIYVDTKTEGNKYA